MMFDWDEDVDRGEVEFDDFHEALEEFFCS